MSAIIDPAMVGCDSLMGCPDHPGHYVAEVDGRMKMTGTLDELEAAAYAMLSMVAAERLSRAVR